MSLVYQNYEILNQIGVGSFSVVYKARRKSDGLIVAIKMIEAQTENEVNLILNEVEVLKHLMGGHQSIPKIYDFLNQGSIFFIIMEYLDGYITLLDWTNTYAPLIFNRSQNNDDIQGLIKTREQYISSIFTQILSSINYLHQKSVVHRDLKLENIMIDQKTFSIKLIDFGFSLFSKSMPRSTICGSFEYLAPEILQNMIEKRDTNADDENLPYSIQSEVWALGIILYGMVFCRLPFFHQNKTKLINAILKNDPSFIPETVISNPDLRCLIAEMLDKSPLSRINLEQISRHPFLEDSKKMIINGCCRQFKSYRTNINKLTFNFKTELKCENRNPDLVNKTKENDTNKNVSIGHDNNAITNCSPLKKLPLSYKINFHQRHQRVTNCAKSVRICARIIAPKISTNY